MRLTPPEAVVIEVHSRVLDSGTTRLSAKCQDGSECLVLMPAGWHWVLRDGVIFTAPVRQPACIWKGASYGPEPA